MALFCGTRLRACFKLSRLFTSSATLRDKKWEILLNTKRQIPAIGLGTWQAKPREVGAAVEVALRAGYRHIDCAHIYGNETEVGKALQRCITEGVVKREEVFITSKLWNSDHASGDVVPACQLSLNNLALDYLDLYLIHWPQEIKKGGRVTSDDVIGYDKERTSVCWKAMEGLVEKGLVKAIGISNFTITKTENLLKTAKIVPAVNQVECHPYFQQPKLKAYCDSKGIAFEAYSPLGGPGRSSRINIEVDNILADPVIQEIAARHEATPAQICIAYPLHRGLVVIPKSVNPDRIRENLKATEVKLDTEDLERLKALDRNLRFLGAIMLKRGQTEEELWDVEHDQRFVLQY